LGYLSLIGNVNLEGIFSKLAVNVLPPILFGQVLQLSKGVRVAVVKHKKKFKHVQVYTLVYIVYMIFCEVFEEEKVSKVEQLLLMVFVKLGLLLFFMVLAWYTLKALFPQKPKLW
jgi:predicted Na+-dependent transporter